MSAAAPTRVKIARPRSPGTRALFIADWLNAVFIHYAVDSKLLQPNVPFPLDVRGGRAYISHVAFTMKHLRFNWRTPIGRTLGRIAALPCAAHELLNVRTYVEHEGEAGIYFLTEWIPNLLSVGIGPRTFGLPYKPASIEYHHDFGTGIFAGHVTPRSQPGCIQYRAHTAKSAADGEIAVAGSLDAFLLERYTAFTATNARRLFRVAHAPWRCRRIQIEAMDDSAMRNLGDWAAAAKMLPIAHATPGVRDVRMTAPRRLRIPS